MEATDFTKQIIDQMFASFAEGQKQGARMIWSAIKMQLVEHWPWVLGVIFILFFVAVTKALMGRWGALGSLLYNLFYLGILFVIALVWGPEIFLENFFAAFSALVLYPLCYFLSGWVLDKTGFRRRF